MINSNNCAMIKNMTFEELFKEIAPQEISEDVFTLASKIFPVVCAGNKEHYNAMTASGGGMGVQFKKPSTWLIFQTNRYTLELIQKYKTYTLSYFAGEYKKEVVFLGSKSGRDGAKMKETALTAVQTPCGNISFKEALLIIECSLTQISPAPAEDFYSQEAKDYLIEVYKDPNEFRKYVFGSITAVWIKKI